MRREAIGVNPIPDAPAAAPDVSALREEILALKAARDAVILAHNYQPGPIQDLADYVGDSLAMARWAQRSPARVLVVAGVHFMAETAAILCPDKRVLIPDPEAGCSLAESITAEQVAAWKAEHPDAVVVSYVNTSAAVKALSDYCCTSSNAVAVVEAIDPEREILFLPDFYLGSHVARVTGRKNLHVWWGECHVHAAIDPETMAAKVAQHPGAELLVHPECGCTTRALALPPEGVPMQVLSTDGMIAESRRSPRTTFIVATEVGLLHRLRKENPDKTFVPAQDEAVCPFMNLITLEKIRDSLREDRYAVEVPAAIRERALIPLERMVAIGR
ncbi:MAG: quinolinate synthase NadA [Firmicutes bacterium]|nr:quinolinate synthase NadA [Alicyclobacillaceae bacterium]MCL6497139.1 quinolinate synthase NadA [Bacillota bacterium]